MTKIQRIKSAASGLVIILVGALMIRFPEIGFHTAGGILSLALLVLGIRSLYYYFSMARYMVDGRKSLYKGIILLNFALFTASLKDIPIAYIILYLIGIYAFAGVVDILRVRDARSMDASSWKLKMLTGAGNLIIVILCLYFGFVRDSVDMVVYIFAAGLFYSGLMRIISAFRRSEIVYIQ